MQIDDFEEQNTIKEEISLDGFENLGNWFANLIDDCLTGEDYTRSNNSARLGDAFCIRKCVFRQDTLDVDSSSFRGSNVIAAETGKAIEKFLVSQLIKKHPDIIRAFNVYVPITNKMKNAGFNTSGIIDLVIKHPVLGDIVVDFKVTGSVTQGNKVTVNAAQKMAQEALESLDLDKALKQLKPGPTPSYISSLKQYEEQVKAYCAFTGIRYGIVFVISRNAPQNYLDNYEWTAHLVEVDEAERNKIFANILFASRAYDQGLLPPIQSTLRKSVECKYCEFRNICYGEEKHRFPIMESDDAKEFYRQCYNEALETYNEFHATAMWMWEARLKEAKEVIDAINGNVSPEDRLSKTKVKLETLLLDGYIAFGDELENGNRACVLF